MNYGYLGIEDMKIDCPWCKREISVDDASGSWLCQEC